MGERVTCIYMELMISIPFLHLRKVEGTPTSNVGASEICLRSIIERCEIESHVSTMELSIPISFLHSHAEGPKVAADGSKNVGAIVKCI